MSAGVMGGARSSRGIGLIELMIAMAIGLFLILGITAVFSSSSAVSKTQAALARLQENGRYALSRLGRDLRMMAGQYCSNASSVAWQATANGPVYAPLAITVNAASASNLGANGAFPDSGGTEGLPPNGWAPGSVFPLLASAFIRGYRCPFGAACSPALPSGEHIDGFPATGASADTRVTGADVLTVRYQSGTGVPFTTSGSGATTRILLAPQGGDAAQGTIGDEITPFSPGDRALVTQCGGGTVLAVAADGAGLSPVASALESTAVELPAGGNTFDARVFNFSRDFVTVSWYLLYRADPNRAGRVLPTLMRKLNGGSTEQPFGDDIAEGVERLDFRFGVRFADGSLHYLDAAAVDADGSEATCTAPGPDWDAAVYGAREPHCLWRSVQSVQVSLLLNSVDDQSDLTDADVAYRYGIDGDAIVQPPPATSTMTYAAGHAAVPAGRLLRREFTAEFSVRNQAH